MIRWVAFGLWMGLFLGGCGSSEPACDELARHLCIVSDEAFCATLKAQAVEHVENVKRQGECRAILDDETKLREVLDGIKAATRFGLKATPKVTPAAKKAKVAKKVKKAKTAQVVPTPESSEAPAKVQVAPPRPTPAIQPAALRPVPARGSGPLSRSAPSARPAPEAQPAPR